MLLISLCQESFIGFNFLKTNLRHQIGDYKINIFAIDNVILDKIKRKEEFGRWPRKFKDKPLKIKEVFSKKDFCNL